MSNLFEIRKEWKETKKNADEDTTASTIFKNSGLKNVSFYGFCYTLYQMQRLNLSGIPYKDCKTFKKWKAEGYQVQKGEKSKISGITWLEVKKEKEKNKEDTFVYPKKYNLFHKTQVKKI